MFEAIRQESDHPVILSHGGPIVTPEDAAYVSARTPAIGFVGASSIERIPVEPAVKDIAERFKAIKL